MMTAAVGLLTGIEHRPPEASEGEGPTFEGGVGGAAATRGATVELVPLTDCDELGSSVGCRRTPNTQSTHHR